MKLIKNTLALNGFESGGGLSRILCKRICKFSHIHPWPLVFVYGTQSQGRDSVHFNLYFVYHIHIIFRGRMWKKRLHNLSDTLHIRNEVCEKGYRNKLLTEEQKENNRRKSKIRCRIEHVFGFMTMSMHGLTVRSIGIARATFHIGLTNLVYNLCRYSFLIRKEAVTG